MVIVRTVTELRAALAPERAGRIGLVPTMGALHRGHLRLVRAAREATGCVVMSIFVNPAQFGDPRDLAAYPRHEAQDAAAAEEAGVAVLFVPDAGDVYPPGFATWVEPGGAALGLEGDFRPGHFRGVATVCLKLFGMVQPALAFFGQKDAQQVAVIRQLVRDGNLPLAIEVVATERDADGLALSSRNVRLTPDERTRALAIPRALLAGLEAHTRGEDAALAARSMLTGLEVDYAAVAPFSGEPTLVIAARVGHTRLIDNLPLNAPALGGLAQLVRGLARENA